MGVVVLHDHRAIIAGFVAESLAYVILSQMLSRGRFHLRTDRATLRAALSFGLPLTINGIALATISQLDRVIVGHWFGVVVLGTYAVLLNVAVVPVSFLLVVFQKLGFSYLLSDNPDPKSAVNADNYYLLTFVYSVLAIAYALWVLLTLDILTPTIFGPAFTVAPTVSATIASMVFLRLQRGGAPTIALLTMGRTSELAFLNFTAIFGLLIALALVRVWPRFESILVGVVFGDFLVLAVFRFASSTARSLRATATADFAISLASLAMMVGTFLWLPAPTLEARCAVFLAGLLGIGMQLAYGMGQQGIRSRIGRITVNHGPSG